MAGFPIGSRLDVFYNIDGDMFVVEYTRQFSMSIAFTLKRVAGYSSDGPEFRTADDSFSPDQSLAEVYVRGDVKWDGCTNYAFPAAESCMEHECDRSGLVALGTMLGRIWDRCLALMADVRLPDLKVQDVVVDVMPWMPEGRMPE